MNVMQRHFFDLGNVEVEVCTDEKNKHFVRHHVYWYIVHRNKNPNPVSNCIIQNLDTIRTYAKPPNLSGGWGDLRVGNAYFLVAVT